MEKLVLKMLFDWSAISRKFNGKSKTYNMKTPAMSLSRKEMKQIFGGSDEGDQKLVLCPICIDNPLFNSIFYDWCEKWECEDDATPADDF